jgi:hypothetical protein
VSPGLCREGVAVAVKGHVVFVGEITPNVTYDVLVLVGILMVADVGRARECL